MAATRKESVNIMACNCIDKKQEDIRNNLSKGNKDYKDKKILDVSFKNGIMVDEGKELYAVADLEYLNSKGVKLRKIEYFSFIYCPFCGEKY